MNRKSKFRYIFIVGFVATRSSKVDSMLICFDKKKKFNPSYQIIITRSPGYNQVGYQIKIKWLLDFLNLALHQCKKAFYDRNDIFYVFSVVIVNLCTCRLLL